MNSKPLLQILLPFITGIILANFFPSPLLPALITTVVIVAVTLVFTKFKSGFVLEILFTLCLVVFGFFRLLHFEQGYPPNHLKHLPEILNLPVEVTGKLETEPQLKKYYQIIQLEVRQIKTGDYLFPVTGSIRGYLPNIRQKLKPGDVVKFGGELKPPPVSRNPGGFDFSKYLALKSIYAILSVKDSTRIEILHHENSNWLKNRIINPVQRTITSRLEQMMTPLTTNLLKGLILGQRQDISDAFLKALSFTGTSHILAVSGLHTGFILLILWLIFRIMRFPSRLATMFTIVGLIFFALLTGAKPPVIRAVIMASIFLVGTQIQRFRNAYNSLTLAALIILIANPSHLFNAGFQLSFSAVFSILYLYPRITRSLKKTRIGERLFNNQAVGYLVNLLIVSLAVWVGTLPIVAYYFYIIPVIGILANIFVVPLIGVLLALGIVALFFSTFSMSAALIYAETVEVLTKGLFCFIESLAGFPGSHLFVPRAALFWFLIYYMILLMWTQWRQPKIRKSSIFLLLILFNLHVWERALFDERRLQVIHFDVGQGDAALVRFPNSQTLLIDGGNRDENFDCGEKIISPYLRMNGISQLDYLLVSHPHNDHIGGLLHILRNFKINQIFVNGDTCNSPIFHEFQSLTDSLKIPQRKLQTGDWFCFSDNVELWVLHPPDSSGITQNNENNNSIVFKLVYGNSTFLFTGDVENLAEYQLLQFGNLLQSDILKIAHHGSVYSSITPFLQLVSPTLGIISVGANNRFKHPSPATLTRLEAEQIKILRTDQSGAICFESDGIETRQINWR